MALAVKRKRRRRPAVRRTARRIVRRASTRGAPSRSRKRFVIPSIAQIVALFVGLPMVLGTNSITELTKFNLGPAVRNFQSYATTPANRSIMLKGVIILMLPGIIKGILGLRQVRVLSVGKASLNAI